MRFSLWPSPQLRWEEIVEFAHHASDSGWHAVYFADHFMPNAEDTSAPVLECWSVLAGLAAAVPRVRLAALVTGNTYRHPAVLANMAAAVDQISGGRVTLGLGAGWQENEHRAYGIDFGTVSERLARLDEACAVVRGLLDGQRANFDGRYYQLVDAPCEPKPVQDHLPLLVGGGGEKVTLRIAARWADEWNTWGTPDVLAHKVGVLNGHCEKIDRDPATIHRSAQALLLLGDHGREGLPMPTVRGSVEQIRDTMGDYVEAGVDEFIVPTFNLGRPHRALPVLEQFMAEVAGEFQATPR